MSSSSIPLQGRIAFEGAVPSQVLKTGRTVHIYLPPSYGTGPLRRYPVLYVHDGQNAFTSAGPWVAYGWGNWQLDRTVDELSSRRQMQEIILVAIDCSEDRYLEYRGPTHVLGTEGTVAKRRVAKPRDDSAYQRYSRFLREELKPKIDREYRTLPGPQTTGVLGSSMGGLCSLALAWEHSSAFGQAASLSGAFQVERRRFLVRHLRSYQGLPKPVRIYLDSGVIDYSGEDDGRKHTAAVADELRRIGWKDGHNLTHIVDDHILNQQEMAQAGLPQSKWHEAETSQHNEFYWRLRAVRALTFLFPPPGARR